MIWQLPQFVLAFRGTSHHDVVITTALSFFNFDIVHATKGHRNYRTNHEPLRPGFRSQSLTPNQIAANHVVPVVITSDGDGGAATEVSRSSRKRSSGTLKALRKARANWRQLSRHQSLTPLVVASGGAVEATLSVYLEYLATTLGSHKQ
ncbi:hypothetical protein VNO80_13149 [Phaseolus coccineus]|uniref:Uncharacterized protein n=1 Tax=Phaseolus coccineus TaxID=3886 RepID=A0AAN9N175_PHACN